MQYKVIDYLLCALPDMILFDYQQQNVPQYCPQAQRYRTLPQGCSKNELMEFPPFCSQKRFSLLSRDPARASPELWMMESMRHHLPLPLYE